jgi:2-keto-myo-inositol isomerase
MIDRRSLLTASATLASGAIITSSFQSPAIGANMQNDIASQAAKLRYCLNVSTINNSKVDIVDQIETASKAGFDGIEIWLRDVQRYLESGRKLPELRNRLMDANLRVESAIAFGQWVVNDDAARAKGLEECGRDMEIVRELGGRLIAAPPVGATEGDKLNLDAVVERYASLLAVGRARDCFPQLEVWGFSKNFARLSEVLYVLAGVQDPDACILPDVYHLYKGGSNFGDVGTLPGVMTKVIHINDYPNIARDKINDADRVYPGDGVAPIPMIFATMMRNGFNGVLSLELFNRSYWEQDRNEVAKTGIAKMKAAIASAVEYANS